MVKSGFKLGERLFGVLVTRSISQTTTRDILLGRGGLESYRVAYVPIYNFVASLDVCFEQLTRGDSKDSAIDFTQT